MASIDTRAAQLAALAKAGAPQAAVDVAEGLLALRANIPSHRWNAERQAGDAGRRAGQHLRISLSTLTLSVGEPCVNQP